MPFNNSISKYDWQYLTTGFFLIFIFIFTDLIGVIDKEYFYFVPKLISDQPHRIFTSIITHADLNHLLTSLFQNIINNIRCIYLISIQVFLKYKPLYNKLIFQINFYFLLIYLKNFF